MNKIFLVPPQHPDKRVEHIRNLARKNDIPVVNAERRKLDQMVGQNQAHQGVIAQVSPVEYQDLSEVVARIKAASGGSLSGCMIAVLDGIEDPHNVGAIIRTAECAGVSAVVLPERRSAAVTSIVAKTSAGAFARIPIVRVTNIVRALESLKEADFWVVGLDGEAKESCFQADLKRPLALVIGSEGEGIGRLIKKTCDFLIGIPMFGKTESLNASVAAAVVFYEVVRQNRLQGNS